MHDQRTSAGFGAQPAGNHLVTDPQQTRFAAPIGRPVAVGEEGTVGDSDGRYVESRTQVQRQTRPSRMVATSAIDEYDVGRGREPLDRLCRQSAHAQR
jgi:hypothetical protein